MNLLEAREILKENGYSVNTLNEGCYGSGTGGKSHAELVYI